MPVIDPYQAGLFQKNPYARKRDIIGDLVVVLDGKLEGRNLQLISPISRAVLHHEIHELIITDESEARPGTKVDRIAYLGFFEIRQGGVLVAGDEVLLGGKLVGTIAGFDITHMPNHLNIVIKAKERITGVEWGAGLGMEIICRQGGYNMG